MDKFVDACLSGECDYPAPVAAVIVKSIKAYDNHGTVSGSGIHAECDLSAQLKRAYDYTEEVTQLWHSSFRGAAVHAMLEACKHDPRFKDWFFERRLFAALLPDDSLVALKVPTKPKGDAWGIADDWSPQVEDWEAFEKLCSELRAKGWIILSGSLDTFDSKHGHIRDWKTQKVIWDDIQLKAGWIVQMNDYALLCELNGIQVKGCKITAFDASFNVTKDVPIDTSESWLKKYFIPRVRLLAAQWAMPAETIRAVCERKQDAPAGFPEAKINYLCDGRGKAGTIYCPVRSKCPAWNPPKAVPA